MMRSLAVSGMCLLGLFTVGCCPRGNLETSAALSRIQRSLLQIQSSLRRNEALHHQSPARQRAQKELVIHRGACSRQDQPTCLAVDLVKIQAEIAALSLSYHAKHPRLAALNIRLQAIRKYQSKLASVGKPRVKPCQLAHRLGAWAHRIESKKHQMSSSYRSKHPRQRSIQRRLVIVKAAAKAARSKCTASRANRR